MQFYSQNGANVRLMMEPNLLEQKLNLHQKKASVNSSPSHKQRAAPSVWMFVPVHRFSCEAAAEHHIKSTISSADKQLPRSL